MLRLTAITMLVEMGRDDQAVTDWLGNCAEAMTAPIDAFAAPSCASVFPVSGLGVSISEGKAGGAAGKHIERDCPIIDQSLAVDSFQAEA